MFIIGENIHIVSPRVKKALAERDKKFFQVLAADQISSGAHALDLNIGPQKKEGVEIMEWLVDAVQEVADVPLSLDTTNVSAIEAGLKRAERKVIINSTSAEPERLALIPPLAAQYGAKLIALTMGKEGIPVSAEKRVEIAMEIILPRLQQVGLAMEDIYLDPLAMTVAGCQEYAPHAVETVRILKQITDPPPRTVVGLSNVSNRVPNENRSLINRIYLVMLMAAGLDAAILDPFDEALRETIRFIEERDDSTPVGRILLKLFFATQSMEELDSQDVDMDDPEQVSTFKTVQILLNKVIYADAYLTI